jgi:uncharacterized membrane protein
MTKIKRDIHINAPVEKVFAYVSEPTNLPYLLTEPFALENAKASVLGGYDYEWTYKAPDSHLEGILKVIEFLTNRQIVMKSIKDIEGVVTWIFDTAGEDEEDTDLTLDLDLEVPASLLDGYDEKAVVEAMDALLKEIKSRVESEVAYA